MQPQKVKPMQAEAVPSLLRRLNMRKVLEIIQHKGPCSRADLTRLTGISPPTMSKLVERLLQAEMIEEIPERAITKGRPGILYRMASSQAFVLGVVLDVGHCTLVKAGLTGQIDEKCTCRLNTPPTYPELISAVAESLKGMLLPKSGTCLGIGLTTPGIIERASGTVLLCPNLHLLDGQHPGRDIEGLLELPVIPLHDIDALTIGERLFGEARGETDFAVMDISDGCGMGVFCDGALIKGCDGFGGEIGHITVDPHGLPCGCGNHGCLETMATDASLAQALSRATGESLTIEEIIARVKGGTLNPSPYLERTLDYLAIGLAAIINIFNPKTIFLHGALLNLQPNTMDDLLLRVEKRALRPTLKRCHIQRATVKKQQGAIAGVIEHLHNSHGPRMGQRYA